MQHTWYNCERKPSPGKGGEGKDLPLPSNFLASCNREYCSSRWRINTSMDWKFGYSFSYLFFFFPCMCHLLHHAHPCGMVTKLLTVYSRFGTFFKSQSLTAKGTLFLWPQFDRALGRLFVLNTHVKQKRSVIYLNAGLECICWEKIKCIYHCKGCKFSTVNF